MKSFFSKIARLLTPQRSEPIVRPASSGTSQPEAAPFAPNNKLETLLVAAANDPSARSAFTRELLEEQLLVATPEAPEIPEQRTTEKDELLSILNVRLQDGTILPALFSSEERVAECFGAGTGCVAMKGSTLLDIVRRDGAFLNPASVYGVRWSSDELAAILGRPVRRTVQTDTTVLLATPAHPPDRLVSALRRTLKNDPRIQEGWLALAQWPDTDDSSWYLDLRSNLSADEISPSLAESCPQELLEGKPIDIVVNSPMREPGIGIRLKPDTDH